jgi:hypothetical protein
MSAYPGRAPSGRTIKNILLDIAHEPCIDIHISSAATANPHASVKMDQFDHFLKLQRKIMNTN